MKTNGKQHFDLHQNYIHAANPKVWESLYGPVPSMQVVDSILYANKLVGAVSAFDDMFKSDDNLSAGLTNVSGAQLPANQFFLITGVSLQEAVAGGTTATDVKAAAYGLIGAAIKSGEISISNNKRPIIEKASCELFDKADQYVGVGDTNAAAGTPVTYTMVAKGQVGYWELECPKMLNPQEAINVSLKFAAALGSANSSVRIVLHGVTNVTL